jgi:hypothetical protein
VGFIWRLHLKDVNYLENTSPEVREQLERAYYIGKPRHAMWLYQAADHIAYFSKHMCWNYEQEKRLVINSNDLDKLDNNMILYAPVECVTAIIAGARITEDQFNQSAEIANDIGCEHYGLFIGQSYKQPFLKDLSGLSYIFNGEEIIEAVSRCDNCKEPIEDGDQELCAWCTIDDVHIEGAMGRNPLRMIYEMGRLDRYIDGFNAVGKK